MNKVAALDKTTRADLFNETAARMNLSPVIVEKDFWVCWTLRHVFSIPRICGKVLFKGGTSLSKVFGLIQRFSEDIDLAVDYEMLGFTGDRDPRQDSLSHTKRRGLLDDMMDACRKWVAGRLIPALAERFGAVLTGADPWTVEVDRQNQDIDGSDVGVHQTRGHAGAGHTRRVDPARGLLGETIRCRRIPESL